MNLKKIEQINLWRERWLAMISYFACYEIQKKNWLDTKNTNPHWSFIEIMCCYFDDLGLRTDEISLSELVKEEYITNEELNAIKNFHMEAARYIPPNKDEYHHQNILNDPKWIRIVNEANDAKSNLKKILFSEIETEKLDHYEILLRKSIT